MLIQQSYRYELKPNNKQKTLLSKHAGAARFTYNWGLARKIEEYKRDGKSSNAIEQHRQLNALKKTEFPWMYEVSKCAPQEALRDLERAFNNFYRGIKARGKIGFPKFKKKGIHDSFRLTGSIHIYERRIILPRIGKIRTKEDSRVKGRVLSATVSKEADRWFVSFAVLREREIDRTVEGGAIGIDVGIECFSVLSDGTRIDAPNPLGRALRLLRRRARHHSRKRLGSNNRKKSALCLGRIHRKIKNKRKDFLHKVTTRLAKTKSVIVVEDLNVRNMMQNRYLSRSISDCGWSEFLRMLDYKTKWYGSRLVKAPRYYPSSKICSSCGAIKDVLLLSERIFKCEICGAIIDRDENAARNLEKLSTLLENDSLTETTAPMSIGAESNACGDTSGSGTTPMLHRGRSTSHVSLNQEADTRCSDGGITFR